MGARNPLVGDTRNGPVAELFIRLGINPEPLAPLAGGLRSGSCQPGVGVLGEFTTERICDRLSEKLAGYVATLFTLLPER